MTALRDQLAAITPVREQEPLARHTTLGIGGPADFYVVADSLDALRALVRVAREAGAPVFLLGSGSNLLVLDGGIRGVVIANRAIAVSAPEAGPDGVRLRAESGANFARLARSSARQGLTGLEWAAGIPGSVGGAVVYNAGAYGGCLADALTGVVVLEPDGRDCALSAADLGLAYRSSVFTRGALRDRVILSAEFRLAPGARAQAMRRVEELETRRKASTPRGRNAGSMFKNPAAHPAWWLIDQVGLRGRRIGEAQISEKHTNYFLNTGQARAADMLALMRLAQERVQQQFGIRLEAEVHTAGEAA